MQYKYAIMRLIVSALQDDYDDMLIWFKSHVNQIISHQMRHRGSVLHVHITMLHVAQARMD